MTIVTDVHTSVVTMPPGRTTFDVTSEPLKVQLETFLDEHRAALGACLDGLTEEQARRSLVPSRTSLRAFEHEECVFTRTWTFDIPRDGG